MIDLERIKIDFAKVISSSQGIIRPEVSGIIDKWYAAKKEFIEMFDSNLIYEVGHVNVRLTEDEKFDKFDSFLDKVKDHFVTYTNHYDELIDFIETIKPYFFENVVMNSYSNGDIKVPAGIKITKAFKFFVEDKEKLDLIQTMASRLLQEEKIEGTLCFSVHPLDYLSSSENNCNWRSCHALNGEYRAGNLSYMLDSSTIICYLKEEVEDSKIPRFPVDVPWNSKKWRMLLFVSDQRNALFAGRHYPFFSKNLMKLVRSFFLEDVLLKNAFYENINDWSYWHNDYLKEVHFKEGIVDNFSLSDKYYYIRNAIFKASDLITDVAYREPLHFNDLLHSSYYEPYYCWTWLHKRKNIHFTIGARVPCLNCGEEFIPSHDSMLCEDCEHGTQLCDYCGCILEDGEGIYLEDRDITVCRDCYSEIFAEEY